MKLKKAKKKALKSDAKAMALAIIEERIHYDRMNEPYCAFCHNDIVFDKEDPFCYDDIVFDNEGHAPECIVNIAKKFIKG